MATWKTRDTDPPSLLFPPDNQKKWFARTEISQAVQTSAAGRAVSIIDLQGWLTNVEPDCGTDPDWTFGFEPDAAYLATIGLLPADLTRPGDLLGSETEPLRARQRSGVVGFKMELDAYPRSDDTRGRPPPPDWKVTIDDCQCPDALWPFDPRLDASGKPLAAGQYVRVVGSLVTDEPHDMEAQPWTQYLLRFGVPATREMLRGLPKKSLQGKTPEFMLSRAAANAARWIWREGHGDTLAGPGNVPPAVKDPGGWDPNCPVRWNEIHSPDYIEIIDERRPAIRRQLHQVAVCAQNGLFAGDVEHMVVDLPGPPDRPANSALRYRQHPSRWTDHSSVQAGPRLFLGDDHLTVEVTVQGQAGEGHTGKYAEVFELWWEVTLKHMTIPTVRVKTDEPVSVTVSATDAATGAPVAGQVLLGGQQVAATGSAFTHTFGSHTEWTIETDSHGRPHRVPRRVADPVQGVAQADGYFPTPIPFLFVVPPLDVS